MIKMKNITIYQGFLVFIYKIMFSDCFLSPTYQLDQNQSLYLPLNYEYNEYDKYNDQREINNNSTLIANFEPRWDFDESEKKIEEKRNSSIKLNINRNLGEDNFNDAVFKAPNEKNKSSSIYEKKSSNLGNLNTKTTSFTSKKTKRSNDNDFAFFEDLENNEKGKYGRKAKDSLIKGKHNKHSEDNMMRKIKAFFFKYVNEQLNTKLKNKNMEFLKLDSEINEKLKKDYNINLMNTKIKNIYLNSPISSKYRTQKTKNYDSNIRIIEKIYRDFEEIDVINALELTYLDLFEEFRTNYLDQFLKHIRDEEEKKKESEKDIIEYLEKIKNLCLNYEEWYKNKKGRNRTKNNEKV